jgi:hypothetical protein
MLYKMEVEKCEKCQATYSGKTTCEMECKTHFCENCKNQWYFRGEKKVFGHDTWCSKSQLIHSFIFQPCNDTPTCQTILGLHNPTCPKFINIPGSVIPQ